MMDYTERKRSVLFGLPLCFTTYFIGEEKITIKRGFIEEIEDDAFMFKIQDVRLSRSLIEKMFGLGTITCYTGDTTHPELRIERIRRAHEIKDFILSASEAAKMKRRTLLTINMEKSEK